MLRALLDNLLTLTLRTVFSIVALSAAVLIFISFTNFPKYERYLLPLQFLKAEPRKVSRNLWVGSYLGEERMLRFLKENRIKVVISLLDGDMYHERQLLEHERRFLKSRGFTFVSVPLKPFVENERSLKRLRYYLRRYRRQRVYVHSYLGRIRTKYIKEVLNAWKGS